MTTAGDLARLERLVDTAGVCEQLEAQLPVGVRPRQLSVRTLLLGMLLAASDGRPAHLTRVHQALTSLPESEQQRLGILAPTTTGLHRLTYRQIEYTFARVSRALGNPTRALVVGSSSIASSNLVARMTSSRLPPARALPTISSDSPRAYTSAASMKVIPASRAAWMIRIESLWSGLPQAPNIIAPRHSLLTETPVRPRLRCSMVRPPGWRCSPRRRPGRPR
jgi:hypothetical protein